MRQPNLFPKQSTRRNKARTLRRPDRDAPICENMLRRRVLEDGMYTRLPSVQCTHRGRKYTINGLITMVTCICCLRRIIKKSKCSVRLVRKGYSR